MTLRLVLVSLVAALGLTIPSVPMFENWVASTQNWMNARFADWDTRNPPNPDYVIVSDYYEAEQVAPHQALSSIPSAKSSHDSAPTEQPRADRSDATIASSGQIHPSQVSLGSRIRTVSFVRKIAAFEPIELGETLCLGFAEELNRHSEGLDLKSALTHAAPAPNSVVELCTLATGMNRELNAFLAHWNALAASMRARSTSNGQIDPLMVFEDLYGGLPRIERQVSPAEALNLSPASEVECQASVPAATLLVGFGAMESSPSLYFSDALAASDGPMVSTTSTPPEDSASKAKSLEVTKPKAVTATITSDRLAGPDELLEDLDIEAAGALTLQDDGFGTWTCQPVASSVVAAARARFMPLEVEAEPSVGVAYELNRRSEGLDLAGSPFPAAPRVVTSGARPARDLSRAMKLTREAVYAWVNVLAGPALVTVSQSNDRPAGR